MDLASVLPFGVLTDARARQRHRRILIALVLAAAVALSVGLATQLSFGGAATTAGVGTPAAHGHKSAAHAYGCRVPPGYLARSSPPGPAFVLPICRLRSQLQSH